MNIAALRTAPKTDALPLEKLAASKAISEEQKVAEASRQFEALLLRQILGQARKPVFTSKFDDNSVSSGIYQDMITQQLAEGISQSGGFGLAGSLQTQLSHQLLPVKDTGPESKNAPVASQPLRPTKFP